MKDKLYTFYKKMKNKSIIKFIYYNFLCRNVTRKNGAFIFPHRGAIIEFSKGSKFEVNANIAIGENALIFSKVETHIRLRKGSVFTVNNTFDIFHGVSIDIFDNGKLVLNGGYISCNSVIMCSQNIVIGKGFTCARNVFIFDSDFHIIEYNGSTKEQSKPIVIGNNVWIGLKSVILKGVTLGDGVVVAACSLVNKDINDNSLAAGCPAKILNDDVKWW